MYIDTHCHLNFPQFDADRAMVIGNAKKAGVKKFIVPGVDIHSSLTAIELSHRHPGVIFASVGFHPYEAQQNPDLSMLEKLVSSNRPILPSSHHPIVAIGECGLDYHMYKGENAAGKKQNQKILFEAQLQLALKYNLPIIIHCREAFEDMFDILDSLPSMPRGVIHCFSAGLQEVRFAQERHLFVGIDGNLTYSKQLQSTLPHIPLSIVLLETDAPYLTPEPHRGTRNEPKYIPLIGNQIGKLTSVSIEKIAEQTTVNAQTLFHLS